VSFVASTEELATIDKNVNILDALEKYLGDLCVIYSAQSLYRAIESATEFRTPSSALLAPLPEADGKTFEILKEKFSSILDYINVANFPSFKATSLSDSSSSDYPGNKYDTLFSNK
jgi:hypothetical protein